MNNGSETRYNGTRQIKVVRQQMDETLYRQLLSTLDILIKMFPEKAREKLILIDKRAPKE